MKKVISVVLSVMLLMTSALCAFAAKPAASVKVFCAAYEVTVTVTTEATDGRMTAILKNKANDLWLDMDQTADYVTNADGKSVYTFNLMMRPGSATDTYTVTVGGNVSETSVDFRFTNLDVVVAYYNSLDVASTTEINTMLYIDEPVLSYDLTDYKALTDKNRGFVNQEVKAWPLKTEIETVYETEVLFATSMDEVMTRARLMDANTPKDDWKALVKQVVSDEAYDGEYTDDADMDTIYNYFTGISSATIYKEDVQKRLDQAQLLAVAKELDYATLQEAFEYYLEKGILSIDRDAYDDVCDEGLADDFFKALKEESNTTIAALENNADEIANDLLDGDSGSGSGSGFGGGGVGRPVGNTGTFMNGDAENADTKTEETVDVSFADLGEAAWAANAIEALAAKGVISGKGDGKFYPNDTVTREEFVKIIVEAFDALDQYAAASFQDVDADRWSYPYIATANRLGLVAGLDADTFNPTGTITREDMAVIMHRAAQLAAIADGAYSTSFADNGSIAGYAQAAVNQLAGRKIINGMGDGTFAPKGTVTRAQAAKVVYELLAIVGGVY